jgi:CRISPR-associated endonuclease Cas3-HD
MKYNVFAHSANKERRWQLLNEHLINVAEQAAMGAKDFNSCDWAYNIGLLHDLGKASATFQKYIKSKSNQDNDEDGYFVPKTNHSGAGAIYAIEKLKNIGYAALAVRINSDKKYIDKNIGYA